MQFCIIGSCFVVETSAFVLVHSQPLLGNAKKKFDISR